MQRTMYDYDTKKKLMGALPADGTIGVKHTAVPEYLFKTDKDSSKLPKENNDLFHKITAPEAL